MTEPLTTYAILFVVTQKPSSLIVLKDEDATRTSGDERKAWRTFTTSTSRFPTNLFARTQQNWQHPLRKTHKA